jgi:hypothetical protein
MTAILVGVCLAAVLLFSIARVLFGSACAVLLTAAFGYCFGGPQGAGWGLIAGLVLAPLSWLLGVLLTPEPRE